MEKVAQSPTGVTSYPAVALAMKKRVYTRNDTRISQSSCSPKTHSIAENGL